jgi:ribosomal 50S subunit-recycling heat shock protein
MSEDACRIDVWLWRARFFKSRTLAGRFVDDGRVRLTRAGRQTRIDKPGHGVKPDDDLLFALSGRVIAVRIAALGDRRGPAPEARALYNILDENAAQPKNSQQAGQEQR